MTFKKVLFGYKGRSQKFSKLKYSSILIDIDPLLAYLLNLSIMQHVIASQLPNFSPNFCWEFPNEFAKTSKDP